MIVYRKIKLTFDYYSLIVNEQNKAELNIFLQEKSVSCQLLLIWHCCKFVVITGIITEAKQIHDNFQLLALR